MSVGNYLMKIQSVILLVLLERMAWWWVLLITKKHVFTCTMFWSFTKFDFTVYNLSTFCFPVVATVWTAHYSSLQKILTLCQLVSDNFIENMFWICTI